MRTKVKKLVAAALTLLCCILPGVLPVQAGTLPAQPRRGADLVVTRKDGLQVKGELVAVKSDSLLLLSPAGKDESVDLKEIRTVRIVRKSRAGTGALLGILAGAVGGAVWGHYKARGDNEELASIGGGIVFGAIGGLIGLVSGLAAGFDDEIVFAGQPESILKSSLAKLNRQARKPGAFAPPQRKPEAIEPPKREATPGDKAAPEVASRLPRRLRFRLTWAAGMHPGSGPSYSPPTDNTVRFIADLPPGEAGPFPLSLWMSRTRPQFSLGRVSLAYEWSRHWSSEIELYAPSRYLTERFGSIDFISSLDGNSYNSPFLFDEVLAYTSLIVGLAFRPFPPEFLQRHVVEVGVAAGPALVRVATTRSVLFPSAQTQIHRNLTWAVKVQAAYDFYFIPAFSMGAFAEYRWLNAGVPEYAFTSDLDYYQANDLYDSGIRRTTEVTVPGRTVVLGGFAYGLRLGLRF